MSDVRYSKPGPSAHGPYLLSEADYGRARECALARRLSSREKGLKDAHGINSMVGLKDDLVGAAGEIAAAKALWVPWPARVDTFKGIADLGERTEVRTSTNVNMSFWLTPRDPEERFYIYILNPFVGFFLFAGWVGGRTAKRIGVKLSLIHI